MANVEYDLKSVKLPRLAGRALRAVTELVENPIGRGLLIGQLLRDAGIEGFRRLRIEEAPTPLPTAPVAGATDGPLPDLDALAAAQQAGDGFAFATVADYAAAYRTGQTTPEAVAERVLDAIDASNRHAPSLRAIIFCDRADVLAQARAASGRIQAGQPLSIFDGVPVAVKDEVDQVPYPTKVGTRFLGRAPAREDATIVARMRAAGALLIGKANMHEIGIGITGLNPHHGTPRNPYALGHYTGGSSSGPAAAVAAGLCPVALGADGGGSIRIPAAFCGVVGLKPTFGRVSEFGAAPLCWSVAHLGPLAATARDAALAYAVMAGPDDKDQRSWAQPPLTLDRFDDPDLRGLKLGVYWPWFNHATPVVVAGCHRMLKALEQLGAQVIEVTIPELEPLRIAHVITIGSEMATGLDHEYAQHRREFGLDVRLNMALARSFTARDYVLAQRVRTRAISHFAQALTQADVLVTPATGCVAPPIPADALPDGESDLTLLVEAMRFAVAANLTGLPAISFPAGYDERGLSIGFQAMGRPWSEHTLLRLANVAERVVERKRPQLHYALLAGG